MADDVDIRVRLLEAARASRDAKMVSSSVRGMGTAAREAGSAATKMGDAYVSGVDRAGRGLRNLAGNLKYAALGAAGLAVAGAKWGLTFDAQVETARMRFRLFTNDADGLLKSLRAIDKASQFSFGDLANAAAELGNYGVQAGKIPQVVQGIANAAAAGGQGQQGLQSIALAVGQIASKGRLMGQEVLQLTNAGAPDVIHTLSKEFHLSGKELNNLGSQALSGKKAIEALTKTWTSGRLQHAAKMYTATLAGQWSLLTTQVQQDIGIFEGPLALALEHSVLPAANKAAAAIQGIFEDKNLSPEQKLRRARQVISRDLGPIADDLKHRIEDAHIPEFLGGIIGRAVPFMASEAVKAGPEVAKAFVSAFLHSGPVGQLATVLYGAAKINKLGRGHGLWGNAGGAAGGLLGVGRSLKPIPVYVVNEPGKGNYGDWLKKFGASGGAAATAKAGLKVGGAAAAAGGLAATDALAARGLVRQAQGKHNLGWPLNLPLFSVLRGDFLNHHSTARGDLNPFLTSTLLGGLPSGHRQGAAAQLELTAPIQLKIGNRDIHQANQQFTAKLKARRAGG